MARVKQAAIDVLHRARYMIEALAVSSKGEVIRARSGERRARISLESEGRDAVRISVAVDGGGLFGDADSARLLLAALERRLDAEKARVQ